MKHAIDVISWVEAVSYAVMSLTTITAWVRRPSAQRGFLALAIGLLAAISVIGRVQQASGYHALWLVHVTVPAFLASGYALALFRHSVMPTSRVALAALFAALAGVSAGSFAVNIPVGLSPTPTPAQWALVWGMVVLWSGCVVEPATRFWLASRGRPLLQRARLRALSTGYGAIVALLVTAIGVSIVGGPAVALDLRYQLAVSIVGAMTVPLLYVGFAPPGWLRRLWRDREESALRRATAELLLESDPAQIAQHSLDWALRLVGADRGLVLGPGRQLLAARDVDETIAAELIGLDPGSGARLVTIGPGGTLAAAAPLPFRGKPGMILVVPGSFTPVFGGDEVTRLGEYAVSVASALDRARLLAALESQTRRNESILAAMSDLGEGFVMSRGGRVVYANDAFCGLTGRSLEELQELPSATALLAPDAERPPVTSNSRSAQHFETAILTPSGDHVDVEIAGSLDGDGGDEPAIVICRDVTKRLRDERELVRRSRELQRSNAALEEFAYIASHDLQEPLRMVASYLQLLDRRYRGQLNAEADDFLGFAVDGARRMQALINDLLLYSRAGGQSPLVPTDCGAVLATVLADLRSTIEESHARVVADPLPTVEGDPTQLAQVFQNLIANAIKFRGDHPPEITVGAERDGGQWVFSVRDTGIGIEQRHAERIFMVFKRLHPQSQYPGTGIGLAICRRVVERHGGRIWVEPAEGGGSVFRFTLPAAAVSVPATDGRQAL